MIQRTPRRNNFTTIGNGIFMENALSFEAMGLLAYLLSKPDNWQVHVQALVRATEGTAQKRGENKILAQARSAFASPLPNSTRRTSAAFGINCPNSGLRIASRKPVRTSSSVNSCNKSKYTSAFSSLIRGRS